MQTISKIFSQWKKYYRENEKICLSLFISLSIHIALLAISSLFWSTKFPATESTLEISVETEAQSPIVQPFDEPAKTEKPAIPETVQQPQNIANDPIPTNVEPIPLLDQEQWEKLLKEGVQEEIQPKLSENQEPSEIEQLLALEEKIKSAMANRKKLTYHSSTKINAKKLQEGRTKGKIGLLQQGGGNSATQTAVEAGLKWLARHQSKNGCWDCDGYMNACKGCTCTGTGVDWGDPATTALAILCFLGGGYNDSTGAYSKNVRAGLDYLLKIQDSQDGCLGPKSNSYMYNHSIATMAMTEGYLMCYDIKYRNSATKAIRFLLEAQNANAGWRYTSRCGDTDTSVTGWCMLALKAGQTAEISIPEHSILSAKHWLDSVTMTGEYPWVGYATTQSNNLCMTAVGTLCRIFYYDPENPNDYKNILGAGNILQRHLPQWKNDANDFYYWYYATLVMYQLGEKPWEEWNQSLQNTLLKNQSKTGCQEGSWGNGAYNGGRVCWTCWGILCLQVYYRYPRFFSLSTSQEENFEKESIQEPASENSVK